MIKPLTIRSRGVLKDVAFIILTALILRILPTLFGSDQNMDVVLFRAQAIPVLDHQNIYQVTHRVFPYTPLSMFIPALCLAFANLSKIPFFITIKIPALIGDISLAVAIYYWANRVRRERGIALKAGLLYAINPIAVLISGFQGNLMPLPTLFMFLAVMMAIYDRDKNYRLSALLLGLSIAFRSYPILLLPLILLKSDLPRIKKLKYVAYALVPTLLISLPFLLIGHQSLFKEMLSYSGFTDYGFAAIERARSLYSIAVANNLNFISGDIAEHMDNLRLMHLCASPNSIIMELAKHSKAIFLSTYLLIVLLNKRLDLLRSVLLVFLAFYFLYSGVSSQYLIWVLPFLYFMDDDHSRWYVILGSYAIVSVYLCYYPRILLGSIPVRGYPDISSVLMNEFFALSLFWGICVIWFFPILFKKERFGVNGSI